MTLKTKRIYEEPTKSDGRRILVDKLWPRGVSKKAARIDFWARRARDPIQRAIKKGAGIGGGKLELEHVVFEGYAPRKVPVVVEVLTDNKNRTAPEIRVLFKRGQLGAPASNKFLSITLDWSKRTTPIRPRTLKRLRSRLARRKSSRSHPHKNEWTVVTSELGYIPKTFPEISDEDRT